MQRTRHGLTALLLVLCVCGSHSVAAKSKRTKTGASQEATGQSFLKALHREHTQLLVIFDPLPHAKRALESPVLQPLSDRITAREVRGLSNLKENLEGWVEDPDGLPQELAFGATDKGVAFLGRLMEATAIVQGMERRHHPDPAAVTDLPERVTALTKVLKQLSFEGLTFHLRMRTEKEAKVMMTAFAAQLAFLLPKNDGVRVEGDENTLRLAAKLNSLVNSAARSKMYDKTLIADHAEHKATLMEATSALEVMFSIQRSGAGLTFELGPTPRRKRALKKRKLGGMFRSHEGDVGWARWSGAPIAKAASQLLMTVTRFGSPEAIERALRQLPGYTEGFAKRTGDLRITHEGRVTRVDYGLQSRTSAEPIRKSVIKRLIPAVSRGVWLSTADGSGLSGARRAVLSLHSALRNWLRPGTSIDFAAAEATRSLHAVIDERFGPLLAGGVGAVLGWGGDVQRLAVSQESTEGERSDHSVSQLPNYGVAWLLPVKAGQDGLEAASAVLGAVVKAACGDRWSADLEANVVSRTKLGLGSPSLAASWGWLEACSIDKRAVEVEGDFVLHALQVEDVLIVSTSKSLSTHIVATASGIKQPKSIPLTKTDTRHGEITGRLIGLYIDMAQRWIPALVGAVRAPEATTKLNNWLFWSQLSYDFLRKIGWQESGRGRRYTGHLEFTWR